MFGEATNFNTNRGDQVASKGYIEKAIKHYQSVYSNVFFLVCSDTIEWCRKNIDSQINVEFIENNTKEVDLSILAGCDHVIQTVGTFSWWAAWLAGGTSVYFQWPAREGSHIRKSFRNQMFQYASSYGVAMLNNMSVIVGADDELTMIFELQADIRKDKTMCMTTKILRERWACAFDNKLLHLNKTENYTLGRWLQSWKYFINVEDKLREQFVFKDHIQDQSTKIIQTILSKRGLNRTNVTLVGIHVRRGDKLNTNRGDQVASKGYIEKAIKHYQSVYSNVFFLVCSDTIEWCRKNIDSKINVEFIENNTKEVDLSILAGCDHVIQTVGTFSWWAAWLAGGTSVYFQWPAREGSHIRKSFKWIGME
ncbi:hypothetical protein KUTeg_004060 [Tegillarca granosa]|uniref:L-Fucosyltransferase n=1 Tax=Tegillarca granosa TaxID=220873 RepID=A0ABQ9FNX1_TEGGR|nr:hypothetical protein KUTeg_004060 [Tegillarca granosa]